VPLSSLRRRGEGIALSTERVVACRTRIARTIRLATGLDPDERIDEGVASSTCGADTETSALDVAPITPLSTETGDTVATSVDDGLRGHAGGLEFGAEHGDVEFLVLGLVILRIGGFGELAGREIVCVPAGDVGGDTADLLGATSGLVDGGELLGSGLC
jgi:hypothetical protein